MEKNTSKLPKGTKVKYRTEVSGGMIANAPAIKLSEKEGVIAKRVKNRYILTDGVEISRYEITDVVKWIR